MAQKSGFLSNEIAEKSLIVHLLADPSRISQVKHIVPEESIVNDGYREIYKIMITLHKEEPNNPQLDYNAISSRASLGGGLKEKIEQMLHNLLYGGTDYSLEEATSQIKEVYARRLMIKQLDQFALQIATVNNLEDVIISVKKSIDQFMQDAYSGVKLIADENFRTNDLMLREQSGQIKISDSISSGLFSFDKMTGGFQRGHVSVIAGRTSMGKTAFACCVAHHAARIGYKTIFFSLETTAKLIMYRVCSAYANLNYKDLIMGRLDRHQKVQAIKVLSSIGHLHSTNHFMVVDNCRSIGSIIGCIYRMHGMGGLDMVVVDFIQMIKDPSNSQIFLKISSYMNALKELAIELNIAVVILSQVSRQVEQSDDVYKMPQLHQLSYSGAIETAADMVCFIYRERYYKERQGKEIEPGDNVAKMHVAKQRNGGTGILELYFQPASGKFYDYEREEIL